MSSSRCCSRGGVRGRTTASSRRPSAVADTDVRLCEDSEGADVYGVYVGRWGGERSAAVILPVTRLPRARRARARAGTSQ